MDSGPAAPRTRAILDALKESTILGALALIDDLIEAARADDLADDPGAAAHALTATATDPSDQVAALAAVHALAALGTPQALRTVVSLLRQRIPFLREHAAWALARSAPFPEVIPDLQALAGSGDFTGTLARATLEAWGMGAAPGETRQVEPVATTQVDLSVAQLFLHADIDGSLAHAGRGDTGGIATLLVHLGNALLDQPGIGRVLTLSRGRSSATPTPDPADVTGPGHHYLPIPLPGSPLASEAWALRTVVRRGVRDALLAAWPVDVLHLRMADVASWAAAEVARELGIPVVLTVAPDPHALIAAREEAGTLTRADFGAADHAEHLVFRVLLLRDLAAQAAHRVVFPRPDLARDLRDLLDLDPDADPALTVVPEGIDLAPLQRAEREARTPPGPPRTDPPSPALAALDALLDTLPAERRDLPLAITVGRLHPVKGMATLVEAWRDPAVAGRCNLLVVGGDLGHPNPDEAGQLGRIDALVPRAEGPARGLLLAGHRPNDSVAAWLAAARFGRPGRCAPGGVYVSASLKEEFGIAILEALASGLVVVAPDSGGPATYVEHGVTGVLTDTGDARALASALASALDLAARPDADARAARAQRLVAERFSIDTMAGALAAIYREVAR